MKVALAALLTVSAFVLPVCASAHDWSRAHVTAYPAAGPNVPQYPGGVGFVLVKIPSTGVKPGGDTPVVMTIAPGVVACTLTRNSQAGGHWLSDNGPGGGWYTQIEIATFKPGICTYTLKDLDGATVGTYSFTVVADPKAAPTPKH